MGKDWIIRLDEYYVRSENNNLTNVTQSFDECQRSQSTKDTMWPKGASNATSSTYFVIFSFPRSLNTSALNEIVDDLKLERADMKTIVSELKITKELNCYVNRATNNIKIIEYLIGIFT